MILQDARLYASYGQAVRPLQRAATTPAMFGSKMQGSECRNRRTCPLVSSGATLRRPESDPLPAPRLEMTHAWRRPASLPSRRR